MSLLNSILNEIISKILFSVLPIQLVDVIGCDLQRNVIFGTTVRNNIIEVDLKGIKPSFIINNEKWTQIAHSLR